MLAETVQSLFKEPFWGGFIYINIPSPGFTVRGKLVSGSEAMVAGLVLVLIVTEPICTLGSVVGGNDVE